MNFVYLHLLLNHFPIIGTLVGLGLLLISLFGKNEDLRRASLIIFPAMALLAILVFFSGNGAQGAIKKLPGVSEAMIERHQGAAMLALLFMEITGALSLVALWKSHEVIMRGALELELICRAAFFDDHGGPHGQSRHHGW